MKDIDKKWKLKPAVQDKTFELRFLGYWNGPGPFVSLRQARP